MLLITNRTEDMIVASGIEEDQPTAEAGLVGMLRQLSAQALFFNII